MKKMILIAFSFVFSLTAIAALPTSRYHCSLILLEGNAYFTSNTVQVDELSNKGLVNFQVLEEVSGQFEYERGPREDYMTVSLSFEKEATSPSMVLSLPFQKG